MKIIDDFTLPDVAALKFAVTSIIARVVSGLSQLYAIKFFLNNLSENEYSATILLLGYLPLFFLFEFGVAQTLQNKFNQRVLSVSGIIKILIFHYFALILIAFGIANIDLFPLLLLNNSILTPTIIENFSIGPKE